MPEQFADELLSSLVRAHIGAGESRVVFEPIATGHFNTSYYVRGGPREMVLRIAPPDDAGFLFYERGMMAQEPGIHAIVREHTDAPVAEIIAYDPSRSLIDRDFLLMERLPGIPLTEFACTPAQFERVLEQTGRCLRQIHEITANAYGYLGEHRCMQPQPDWPSAFRIMWDRLIDDIVSAGYYDREEESYVKGLLERYLAHFDRPVTSRLLHMDIWSQNLLVDSEANLTGLVDFDRALWGDREIEFAVLDYCGISEPAFWRGYGADRDLSQSARIRLAFYLLYEVQKYIVIYHYRNRQPHACERYKQQSMRVMASL